MWRRRSSVSVAATGPAVVVGHDPGRQAGVAEEPGRAVGGEQQAPDPLDRAGEIALVGAHHRQRRAGGGEVERPMLADLPRRLVGRGRRRRRRARGATASSPSRSSRSLKSSPRGAEARSRPRGPRLRRRRAAVSAARRPAPEASWSARIRTRRASAGSSTCSSAGSRERGPDRQARARRSSRRGRSRCLRRAPSRPSAPTRRAARPRRRPAQHHPRLGNVGLADPAVRRLGEVGAVQGQCLAVRDRARRRSARDSPTWLSQWVRSGWNSRSAVLGQRPARGPRDSAPPAYRRRARARPRMSAISCAGSRLVAGGAGGAWRFGTPWRPAGKIGGIGDERVPREPGRAARAC